MPHPYKITADQLRVTAEEPIRGTYTSVTMELAAETIDNLTQIIEELRCDIENLRRGKRAIDADRELGELLRLVCEHPEAKKTSVALTIPCLVSPYGISLIGLRNALNALDQISERKKVEGGVKAPSGIRYRMKDGTLQEYSCSRWLDITPACTVPYGDFATIDDVRSGRKTHD